MLGTVLANRFRIERELGVGSMGVVYEAVRLADGRAVALKLLRPELGREIELRFKREGKALALFDHPNIVKFIEAGDDGAMQFLATELVTGETLRDLMERGPIEPRRALAIIHGVLLALDHIHARGVVHRDLKPENIMLVGDGVKLIDFGVAKLADDTAAVLEEQKLTRTGFEAFGTALYIPPEVALGRAVDPRSDLYALGAILYEMIAGTPVFDAQDVLALMRHHAATPPPPLPGAGPELQLVLSESLAKQPDQRFRSAVDMTAAVERAQRALEPLPPETRKGVGAPAPAPVSPPAAPQNLGYMETAFVPDARLSARQAAAASPLATAFVPEVIPSAPPAATPAPLATAFVPDDLGAINRTTTFAGAPVQPPAPPSEPMAMQPMPSARRPLSLRAKQGIAVGVTALVIIIIVAVSTGGSKPAAATGAAAAKPAPAASASALDEGRAQLMEGHTHLQRGDREDALAAYERALKSAPELATDEQLVANLPMFFDGKDAISAVVALELAARAGQGELVVTQSTKHKLPAVRKRALAIVQREGFTTTPK